MNEKKTIKHDELLALPVSITSWIVLRDYVTWHADLAIYKKLISEYREFCTLLELERIFLTARRFFDEEIFQELVEYLFNQYHMDRDNQYQY